MAEIHQNAEDNLSLEKLIREVNYKSLEKGYVPSQFALKFINFIKLVNGNEGEENKSPLFHYEIADQVQKYKNNLIVAARGTAKTSLMEYLLLYIATFGHLDGFGDISVIMYVGDTMDNGCKNLRKNLEFRYDNSEFLKRFVPKAHFTDVGIEFINADGHKLFIKMFGASPLSLDSTLHLEDGSTTTIGECKVGDKIFGSDGKLTTIECKSEIFYKPTYRITLKDGRSLKVSEDHINSVVKKIKATGYTQKFELHSMNLTTLELLKEDLFYPNSKENKWFIPNPSALEYIEKDLPLDPYTLGLLLGDGQMKSDGSNNLTAHTDDMDFYVTQIPYEFGTRYKDLRHPDVHNLTIKKIYKEIASLGLRGVHTYDKFVPQIYKVASKEQRLELLRGLLDTDGSVSKRKLRSVTYYSSTSKKLVDDITDIVRSLGGYTMLGVYDSHLKPNNKGMNKVRNYKLFIHLNEYIFKLPRKKVLQSPNHYKNTMVGIMSIEQIKTEPTQCIGVNNDSHQFVTTDYIVTHNTGVRGFKVYGKRPTIAILDDLFTDKAAESKTIIKDIENIIYKAVRQALHPTKRKVIWIGTPFNKKDPLYKAAGTKEWNTKVYPICQKFPCTKAEFVGAWEDRFPYEAVKAEFDMLKANGKVDAFNQELMLRILSDDDRLVLDEDIIWYPNRSEILNNLNNYFIYMTTDFATSELEAADFSVIALWALDYNGVFHWFDGVCKRQDMAKNVDDVFRFVEMYHPLSVGVEISGQQKGFVSWLKRDMSNRNIWFTIASDKNSKEEGLRPTTSKLVRFNAALPLFKQRRMAFPKDLEESEIMLEYMDELTSITPSGIKSLHDDCVDSVSQLQLLTYVTPFNPSNNKDTSDQPLPRSKSKFFSIEEDREEVQSYIV